MYCECSKCRSVFSYFQVVIDEIGKPIYDANNVQIDDCRDCDDGIVVNEMIGVIFIDDDSSIIGDD